MAIDLTPEERTAGQENFEKATDALGLNRRSFLKAGILGAGAVAGSSAAVYFGYQSLQGNPVRAALIGGGDEGGVLVGEHNKDYLRFVAVCDIRPTNMTRIFDGEPSGLRKGLRRIYGAGIDSSRSPDYIRRFDKYQEFLDHLEKDLSIEAVVIATPLFLHAKMSIDCMRVGQKRGKPVHVLCEKLMAWNINQCKQMLKVAHETGSILSIGHQRHYSMLYSHAQEVVKSGILGEIRHIRALWHRNFSWLYTHDEKKGKQAPGIPTPTIRDGWYPPVVEADYNVLKDRMDELKGYGYDPERPIEQLIRWRLFPATGGGLMAELGSHQLDACSIFLGKVRPLSVQGVGGRFFFDGPGGKKNPRDIDDHVFVTYEFPGKNYYDRDDKGEIVIIDGKPKVKDADDRVVVTYSSISTNGFEKYGETLMGTRGTMIVEAEQQVMLYTEPEPGKPGNARKMEVSVSALKAQAAAADASSTWGGPSATVTPSAGGSRAASAGPISRGYREEMEDFAYCVRVWNAEEARSSLAGYYAQRQPRCHGKVAMADAIIALAANETMKEGKRVEFLHSWFEMQDEGPFSLPTWKAEEVSVS